MFVPKFGIEGPVFLEDAEAAAAAAGRGQPAGSAVASSYIYDEDKQVGGWRYVRCRGSVVLEAVAVCVLCRAPAAKAERVPRGVFGLSL